MHLGAIVKKYRKEHHLSMDAFAEMSGLSKAYISMLEKNEHPKTKKPISPSLNTIEAVARVMNCDVYHLVNQLTENTSSNSDFIAEEQDKSHTDIIQESSAAYQISKHVDASLTENQIAEIIDYIEFMKQKNNK